MRKIITKIKEKIRRFCGWALTKAKKISIGIGVIGVASAASLILIPEKDRTVINVDGVKIEFAYTDDNSNENIIISTDKNIYRGRGIFGGTEDTIYLKIENKSGKADIANLQFVFSDNINIDAIYKLDQTTLQDKEVNVWGLVGYSCDYTSTTTKELIKQTCQKEKVIGTTTEKQYVNGWIKKDMTEVSVDYYEQIKSQSKLPIKDKLGINPEKTLIEPYLKGAVEFYRADISFLPKMDSEFFVEIIGQEGSYGFLDPTILTDPYDFNSLSGGAMNGQDGWVSAVNPDRIQIGATTTYEGAFGVEGVAIPGEAYKSGASTTAGIVTVYMRPTAADNETYTQIWEGGTVKTGFGFNSGSVSYQKSGVGMVPLFSYTNNNWYVIQAQWDIATDVGFAYRATTSSADITLEPWSATATGYNAIVTAVDKINLSVGNTGTGLEQIDYIASGAFASGTSPTVSSFETIIYDE